MPVIRTGRPIAHIALAVLIVALLVPGPATSAPPGAQRAPENRILARALEIQRGAASPNKYEMPLSGGVMNALVQQFAPVAAAPGILSLPAPATGIQPPTMLGGQGCPKVRKALGRPDNVRVNQDCSLRRQAEEVVVVNPTNFSNLIAGQNDSRIGFNHCGYDWSLDRGRTWGDTGTSPPPFWQMLLGDGHTSDACSDPSATFDHKGNAYITGVFFDVAADASAIFVAKSNAPIGGRFYHTPQPGPFQLYSTGAMGTPASDNDPGIFHDKEFIVADSRPNSAKKGRVYVTWTRFELTDFGVGIRSPIVFSQSLDGGATWSPAIIISGSNAALCTVFSGSADPNACDQDQGSHPVVGPDGTIYVVFGNGNTPLPGINQVLFVKCPPGKSCTNPADWTAPVKVGDLIGTHPIGDPGNVGGCPVGRQCLPPNGYRVPEFTSMTISVDKNKNLYVTWSDFRNGDNPGSTCGPLIPWSAAAPPCNNDVFYAFSTNGGTTWSATRNVTPPGKFGQTAQWQPWSDVRGDGSKLFVAFYDRGYGSCESTGCNDVTLATIQNPRSASPTITYRRITTSSMPNLVPANNPVQAGFLGDYMWLEVSRHSFNQLDVHIVWADTRQLFGPAPEEDIYYARIRFGEAGNK